MDRGAWWATVHGVAKSWTRLSDFTHFDLTDGLGQIVSLWAEQRHLRLSQAEGQGYLRQAIMYDYNNNSNKRLKSKKLIQQGVEKDSSKYR